MAANKTVASDDDVGQFVETIGDAAQGADARALIELLSRVSSASPRMWGPSIIGFGSYRYKTDAGREGTMCRIGFSPRKGKTVVYGLGIEKHADVVARLGKHSTGKGCLNIRRLSDLDLAVLEELAAAAWKDSSDTHPE